MVTKEELKKVVDRLPENLLNEVFDLLRKLTEDKSKKQMQFTKRDFRGTLDREDIRKTSYE
jgi:ribosomal 50S subunit-associated protein YjgA (DUF615 family)